MRKISVPKKYLITFFLLGFLLAGGLISQPAAAIDFGLYGDVSFTNFFEDDFAGVIEEELVVDEDDEDEEAEVEYVRLSYDITSTYSLSGGAWVELLDGVPIAAEFHRMTAADFDRVPPEIMEAEGELRKELTVNSVRMSIGMNLAEFAEIYNVPAIVLSAGGGFYFGNYLQEGEMEIEEEEVRDISEDDDGSSLGFHLGARYENQITDLFSVRLGAKYRLLDITFDQNYNLSGFEVSAGASVGF